MYNQLASYGRRQVNYLGENFAIILDKNGCDTMKLQAEWYQLKLVVQNNYKHLLYTELWKLVLTDQDMVSQFRNISHLVEIMLVLPISTAGVERGFSTMRRIKTDKRLCLGEEVLDDLMRISIEGPIVKVFDPKPAMLLWKQFEGKERRPGYKNWPTDEEFLRVADLNDADVEEWISVSVTD